MLSIKKIVLNSKAQIGWKLKDGKNIPCKTATDRELLWLY